MALFKKKSEYPENSYTYKQSEDYKEYKRIKLSSYNFKLAQDGIRALSGKDLTGATIKITVVNKPGAPYATVMVGKNIVGTIFKSSFDKFNSLKNGKVDGVRLEIQDGDSYLLYHIGK